MRLIIMRHGESQNNILGKISNQAWSEHRTSEPELSAQGVDSCRRIGERLTQLGIKIDLMITSAHKRAILSLKNVRDTYALPQPTCEIMTQIHEESGVNMAGQIYPGLSRSQVIELMPDLYIPEDQSEILTEDGWCRLEHEETDEEIHARAKLCVLHFKELAKN